VVFKEKPLATLQEKQHDWDEKMTTVASLRLDAVLKSIYNMSRKDVASVIAAEHVKVNFKVIDDDKFILQEGDMLSVREKGRSKLVRINRSEEHTSELQSRFELVCRPLPEHKQKI